MEYEVGSGNEEGSSRWKLWAALGGLGTLLIFGLIIWGLYSLGDSDQSALERFRDIAVIFIIFLFMMTIVLLAAIVAALGYLTLQVKDRAIPLLEELNGTLKRLRGTADFMTQEAVKPLITVASSYAKMRATVKTVVGKNVKKR